MSGLIWLLPLLGLVLFWFSIRNPLIAVAVVPAGTGVANIRMQGLPFDLLLVHLLVLAAISAVAAHVLLVPTRRVQWPPRPAVGTLVLTLIFGLVVVASAVLGIDPIRFAGVTVTILLGVAYCMCLAVCARTASDAEFLLASFAVGSLMACAPALTQSSAIASKLGGAIVDNRPTGGFYDPNELGVFAAVSLVLSVTLVLVARSWMFTVIGASSCVVSALALMLSFSRLSWAAAVVGVICLLCHRPAR